MFEIVRFVLVMLKMLFGFEVGKEFFFAESAFGTSSRAVVCQVWPFAVATWNWVMFPVHRVVIALTLVMPPLATVSTLAFVFLTRLLSVGLKSSLLLRVFAIFLGISFRFSLGNRLDKSVLFMLLSKEKLLLTKFIIAIEIVTSSEIMIIQLSYELVKACTPYNLDFA